MKSSKMKKRLISLMLVLSYLLNGCGLQSDQSEKKDDKDTKESERISHEIRLTKMMERYKENKFVQDFEFFNDTYPEFYISDGLIGQSSGVLDYNFENLTGGIGSVDRYFVGIMDMYAKNMYQKDENGNLVFDWTDKDYSFKKADTTTFSYVKDETGKTSTFEDKKGDNVVFNRLIKENGKEITSQISLTKDLSEDIHVSIVAKRHQEDYIMSDDAKMINNSYESVLMIDYRGEIYTFNYHFTKCNGNSQDWIELPIGMVDDKDIEKDIKFYHEFMRLVCYENNYTDGINAVAIKHFENFLLKKRCLELYYRGDETNPWYNFVTELIDTQAYEQAINVMLDESNYWFVSEKLILEP